LKLTNKMIHDLQKTLHELDCAIEAMNNMLKTVGNTLEEIDNVYTTLYLATDNMEDKAEDGHSSSNDVRHSFIYLDFSIKN